MPKTEQKKEHNATFQRREEFDVAVSEIIAQVKRAIKRLNVTPVLNSDEERELFQEVLKRLITHFDKVPRGRGRSAYIKTVVHNTLVDLRNRLLPIATFSLVEGVDLREVLPKGKYTQLVNGPPHFPAGRTYRGRILGMTLEELQNDERVEHVLPEHNGEFHPYGVDEDGKEVDTLDEVAVGEPFARHPEVFDAQEFVRKLQHDHVNDVLPAMLHHGYGYTQPEIAKLLNCKPSHLRTQLEHVKRAAHEQAQNQPRA